MSFTRSAMAAGAVGVLLFTGSGPAQASQNTHAVTVYMHRADRQVVDVGASGASIGDMAFAWGSLSKTAAGPAIGSYTFRGLTLRTDIPGGVEDRDALIQYMLPGGTVLIQQVIHVPLAATPVKADVYAITGGTGTYSGARGSATVKVINPAEYVVTFRFTSTQ